MTDVPGDAPLESVHSEAASAHISHAVIATYAAAAAGEVPGVRGIAGSHFGPLERRIDPERAPRGVRVIADEGRVGLELHLVTEWGASIPRVAGEVERQVREYLASMVDLDVADIAVVIDDIAAPAG
jgi:uncharacterized alkaline shock family protein YloU